MQIASVRALKQEVRERVLPLMLLPGAAARGVPAEPLKRLRPVEPTLAVGVARAAAGRGYRLAVRLQRRQVAAHRPLLERLEALAKSELDIAYIGRVTRRARKPVTRGPGLAEAPARDLAPPLVAAGRAVPRRAEAERPWHQLRQRPLLIGASVAHVAVTAGTIGAFVRGAGDDATYLLSNNHVVGNEGRGRIGDGVLQPGPFDGGRRRRDRIGGLARFVPLQTTGNLVDGALARLDPDIAFEPTLLRDVGTLRTAAAIEAEPGLEVMKLGRTTGLTRGRVTAIELDGIVVGFDQGELSFDGQIEIESTGDGPFSAGGDSGSLIFDENGQACGLLFAGSDQGGSNGQGLTFANDLGAVLGALEVGLAV